MDTQINNTKPVEIVYESLKDAEKTLGVSKIIDNYEDQLKELFLIRNPHLRFVGNYQNELDEFLAEHANGKSMTQAGNWFYFPWNNTAVHYLLDEMHQELRTARNKNLITGDEQDRLYKYKVGVAGLSVGSHAVSTMAMMGMAHQIKIADGDEISGSNLNRIRSDFTMVGVRKCDNISRFMYQLNPYAQIEVYQELNASNIQEFFEQPFRLDVLVDELDNLEMKIRMRLKARELGIPVVMATDNGDNVIVDVERYDQNRHTKLFNGAIDENDFKDFQKINPQDLPKFALQIAGKDMAVTRVLGSLAEVGKSLYSWPQLGDAATLSGVAVAYVVKRLALNLPLHSGKYEVNLDSIFTPDFFSAQNVTKREIERDAALKKLGE